MVLVVHHSQQLFVAYCPCAIIKFQTLMEFSWLQLACDEWATLHVTHTHSIVFPTNYNNECCMTPIDNYFSINNQL